MFKAAEKGSRDVAQRVRVKVIGDAGSCGLLLSSLDLIFLQRARRDGVRASHQANTIAYNLWKAAGPPPCRSTTGHVYFSFVLISYAFIVSRHNVARRNSPRETWDRERPGP